MYVECHDREIFYVVTWKFLGKKGVILFNSQSALGPPALLDNFVVDLILFIFF